MVILLEQRERAKWHVFHENDINKTECSDMDVTILSNQSYEGLASQENLQKGGRS